MKLGTTQSLVQSLQFKNGDSPTKELMTDSSFLSFITIATTEVDTEIESNNNSELDAILQLLKEEIEVSSHVNESKTEYPDIEEISTILDISIDELMQAIQDVFQTFSISEEMSELSAEEQLQYLVQILNEQPIEKWSAAKSERLEVPIQVMKVMIHLVEKQSENHRPLLNLKGFKQEYEQLTMKIEAEVVKSQPSEKLLQQVFQSLRTLPTADEVSTPDSRPLVQEKALSLPSIFLPASLSKLESFSLHLKNVDAGPTYETFVKEFSSILSRAQFGKMPNMNKLLIKLYPEELGSLRIELLQKDGMITARILTSSGAARDLIDSQLHALKQSFQQQNLSVEKIEVQQMLGDEVKKEHGHAKQQQQQKEQSNHEEPSKDESTFESFKDFLLNLEI
ncbi:flagellar hook-length control protein FliK [Bacillus sp. 2205SS5-2]|uniref:flagellar hook-length control protein FliK n=1 Tax=Bacillus sp. 2205SS5-2 TaxID=3109031 RepID=UPI00300681F2